LVERFPFPAISGREADLERMVGRLTMEVDLSRKLLRAFRKQPAGCEWSQTV
jgi:hypothetical protein